MRGMLGKRGGVIENEKFGEKKGEGGRILREGYNRE